MSARRSRSAGVFIPRARTKALNLRAVSSTGANSLIQAKAEDQVQSLRESLIHPEWQPYGYRYVNAYDPNPLPFGERGLMRLACVWSGTMCSCDFLESHQRAGAVVGEQLQQHGVRHLAVEDDHALDARFEGVDAGLDLGDHA